jgi:hypothetical protein
MSQQPKAILSVRQTSRCLRETLLQTLLFDHLVAIEAHPVFCKGSISYEFTSLRLNLTAATPDTFLWWKSLALHTGHQKSLEELRNERK